MGMETDLRIHYLLVSANPLILSKCWCRKIRWRSGSTYRGNRWCDGCSWWAFESALNV